MRFLDRRKVVGIDREGRRLRAVHIHRLESGDAARRSLERAPRDTGTEVVRPRRVVNAAGAWAADITRLIGAEVHTRAVRRQVSIFSSRDVDLSGLGMIVDTTGVYLHHEGGDLILGGYSPPGDPPGYDFTYEGSAFFEREIWPRLVARMSGMDRLAHVRGWAGLYGLTPDNSAILGRIEGVDDGYEIHSFSGRGVMQSWAAGRAVAELMVHGEHRTFPLAARLDASRFSRGERELEDLHI